MLFPAFIAYDDNFISKIRGTKSSADAAMEMHMLKCDQQLISCCDAELQSLK